MLDVNRYLNATLGSALMRWVSFDCADAPTPVWFEPASPWLIVIADDLPLEQLHAAFRPIRDAGLTPPIVVREKRFDAYCARNPLAAYCLTQEHVPSPDVQAAYLALRLMRTTPVLFSEQPEQLEALLSLAHLLDVAATEPTQPAKLIATIHATIKQQCSLIDEPDSAESPITPSFPQLCAVYEELDTAILVLADEAAPQIATIDWERVAALFKPQFRKLLVTTATHLRLIARHELITAFFSDQYRLIEGIDLLAAYPPDPAAVIRAVQRHILNLETDMLSTCCLGTEGQRLRHNLHALQNQILKIQLQYEVLSLYGIVPSRKTPAMHVGVADSGLARMQAIEHNLAAWYALYEEVLSTFGTERGIT